MKIGRNCKFCGMQFTVDAAQLKRGRGRYCSRSCRSSGYWDALPDRHRPRYLYVNMRGHPLSARSPVIPFHRAVLFERIGPGSHPCYWCGAVVEWRPGGKTRRGSLVVDHLDGDSRNNAPYNLVPSCHGCNSKRGRKNPVSDDELYVHMTGGRGRHRAVPKTCETCGKVFAIIAADKRPNRGRFCSRKCMYRRHRSPT